MNRKKVMFGVATALTFSSTAFPVDTVNANLVETENINAKSVLKVNESEAVVNVNLHLRKEPRIKDGNIILTMKKGSKIKIISTGSQWAKVKYGNKEGYVSLKYISMSDVNAKTGVLKRVKVNTSSLNVRVGASTKYKIIGSVKKNTVLEVYGFNNSWAKIKYNNKDAYVSTKYLVDVVEETASLNKKMEVTGTNSLNIRSGPGTNYSIKGKLTKGSCIDVLSISNGWARFKYKNANAYASVSYLKEVSSQNNTATDTSVTINKNMYVSASKTLVRSGQGTNYSILGTLKQNQSVYVKKQMSSGWSQVTYNNKIAYVLTKDLTGKPTQSPVEEGISLDAYKKEVLRLVNIERAKEGLGALSMDSALSKVAQLKSQDMINNNYFAHNSPVYGTPFEMMKSHGITYRIAGENIAMGHSTPQEVVRGWMNSAGHRKNIMNTRFTNLGMGIAQAKSGRIYWTQMFTGQK